MKTFLDKFLAPKPGDIVTTTGQVLGQHDGIHHYTIGQRKGLGIAAPNPLYVVSLDVGRNQVVVGERDSVTSPECLVHRVNWVSIAPPISPISVEVQIRYRSPGVKATVIPTNHADKDSQVRIIFDEPQFGVTPGQAAVWYDSEGRVLGGGIIEPTRSDTTDLTAS